MIIILVPTKIASPKTFRYEEEKYCEVSQYTNLFFSCNNFCCILLTSIFPNMLYTIPRPSIFIYWSVIITYSAWFLICICKSIIINFIPILQKGIYILSSCSIHRSLMSIRLNHHLPFMLLIFNIFKHMFLRDFGVYNITHLWTQCNSLSSKSSRLVKIQSRSLLANLMTSLLVIVIPMRESHFSLLGYFWPVVVSEVGPNMRHQHFVYFYVERSKRSASLTCFRV